MNEVIGVDLAKMVFQLHGATAAGAPVFRKKLSRTQFRAFMTKHPRCRVAMEPGPQDDAKDQLLTETIRERPGT